MTDELLIGSFTTMNQLKTNDTHLKNLIQQRDALKQKLTSFYEKHKIKLLMN